MKFFVGLLVGVALALGGIIWHRAGMPGLELLRVAAHSRDECGAVTYRGDPPRPVVTICAKRAVAIVTAENIGEHIAPHLSLLGDEQSHKLEAAVAAFEERVVEVETISMYAKSAAEKARERADAANRSIASLSDAVDGVDVGGGRVNGLRQDIAELRDRAEEDRRVARAVGEELQRLDRFSVGLAQLLGGLTHGLDRQFYLVRKDAVNYAEDIAAYYVAGLRKELAAQRVPVSAAPPGDAVPPAIDQSPSPPAVRPAPRVIPVVPAQPEEPKTPPEVKMAETVLPPPPPAPPRSTTLRVVEQKPAPAMVHDVGRYRLRVLNAKCSDHLYRQRPQAEAEETLQYLDDGEFLAEVKTCAAINGVAPASPVQEASRRRRGSYSDDELDRELAERALQVLGPAPTRNHYFDGVYDAPRPVPPGCVRTSVKVSGGTYYRVVCNQKRGN